MVYTSPVFNISDQKLVIMEYMDSLVSHTLVSVPHVYCCVCVRGRERTVVCNQRGKMLVRGFIVAVPKESTVS